MHVPYSREDRISSQIQRSAVLYSRFCGFSLLLLRSELCFSTGVGTNVRERETRGSRQKWTGTRGTVGRASRRAPPPSLAGARPPQPATAAAKHAFAIAASARLIGQHVAAYAAGALIGQRGPLRGPTDTLVAARTPATAPPAWHGAQRVAPPLGGGAFAHNRGGSFLRLGSKPAPSNPNLTLEGVSSRRPWPLPWPLGPHPRSRAHPRSCPRPSSLLLTNPRDRPLTAPYQQPSSTARRSPTTMWPP